MKAELKMRDKTRGACAGRFFIEHRALLRVRFNEVDAMQVVWHGHYANYFEEGRRAFGRQHGLDYTVFFEQNVAAPVVRLEIDYVAPARMADELEITARLFKTEAAKLEFEYEVRRVGGMKLLARGRSAQVFTTLHGELLLTWPAFMAERLRAWEPLWRQS
jgi:acyl-CoA thioester hydrolase